MERLDGIFIWVVQREYDAHIMMMMPSTVVKPPSYCIPWHSKRNN